MSLSTSYMEYGPQRHAAQLRRRRREKAPTSNTTSHDNNGKINSCVSFSFLYEYGAPLGDPSGRWSSANILIIVLPGLVESMVYKFQPIYCWVSVDQSLSSNNLGLRCWKTISPSPCSMLEKKLVSIDCVGICNITEYYCYYCSACL